MNSNPYPLDLKNPKNWVISKIISFQCKKNPDFEIIEFTNGQKWTYKKMYSLALKNSNYINELEIKKEDSIMVMIDCPKKFIPLWLGAALLGVKFIAINTSLRGNALAHQVTLANPKVIFFFPQ